MGSCDTQHGNARAEVSPGRHPVTPMMPMRKKHHLQVGAPFVAMVLSLFVFGATGASAEGPPQILSTTFSALSTDSATLQAEVDPQGKATKYHFEYGAADCAANPCTSVPLPEPQIPGSSPPVVVSVTVKGLIPDSTYHFRVLAKNSLSPTPIEGPDTIFHTYLPTQSFAPCSNDAFRASIALPDCRAYEQASPVDKNGADINGAANEVQAATDGDAITFFSAAGLPGAVGAQEFETYLARREGGVWVSKGVYPPAAAGPVVRNAGWTPDLSLFFSNVADSFIGPWVFRLRSSADGSFAPISEGASREGFMVGASADGQKVYFQNPGQLDPATAPKTENLYVWDRAAKATKLAGVLPDSACGSPPCVPVTGSFGGPYSWFQNSLSIGNRDYYVQNEHTVSTDGSRAYFTTGDGQIYLRKNATDPSASTVHVSATQKTPPDVNGTRPAAFMAATPDGSTAYFTSPEKLTDDATTGPEPPTPAIALASVGDGTGKDLDYLPANARGVAVDAEFIYWADPKDNSIGRAEIGGGDPKPEFITGASNPQYVAINVSHIFWTNAGDEVDGHGSIGRSDINGKPESVNQSLIAGERELSPGVFEKTVNNPRGIAVDASFIYWANAGEENATRSIGRAEINGGNPNGGFINDFGGLSESPVAVAVSATRIYWTTDGVGDKFGYLISRNLTGSKATEKFIVLGDGSRPFGLAIDAGHAYWTANGFDTIGRVDLELSEGSVEKEFITGAEDPEGLAVDDEHLYWSANQKAPVNPGNDLYRFDAESGDLTDISVDTGDTNGAEVKGVLGTSEDGSYLYYAANGVPDGVLNSPNGRGESAAAGNCQGSGTVDDLNFSGQCNLYLWHAGETTFIARLDAGGAVGSDAANWEPAGTRMSAPEATARVSADGQTLLFRSRRQLSAYPNQGVPELYLYHAGEDAASCISCNPTGAPPVGRAALQSIEPFLPLVKPPGKPAILTRNLSTDGRRVFFETPDKLVIGDVNGEGGCPITGQALAPACQDVYEWEAAGTGSCEGTSQNGGCLYLLSSGTGPEPSFFADASASGEEAFVFTRDRLVPQDKDQIQDVYDIRSGGGLAYQHPVSSPVCEGEAACKAPPSSLPPFDSPQTPGFRGPTKVKPKPPCTKRKRKKHSCSAKRHKHKHRHKAHKSASGGSQ
jgi:hypothetical protein